MEAKSKEEIMQELKATLRRDIELQESLRETYNEILKVQQKAAKRTGMIFFSLAVISLVLTSFLIYYVTRPIPAPEISIRTINDWNKVIMAQRKFVQYDREDVAAAREQVSYLLNKMDSIITKTSK